MARHKTNHSMFNVPKKAELEKKDTWYEQIAYLQLLGCSPRTIAARIGCKLEEYRNLIKDPQVEQLIELSRAQQEIEAREVRDRIAMDEEMNPALRLKAVSQILTEIESRDGVADSNESGFAGFNYRIIGVAKKIEQEEDDEDSGE